MNSRLNNNLLAMALLFMSTILMGCQDTIPARGLIEDGAIGTTTGSTTGGVVTTERPDNAVKFKTDFCGCKDGAVVTFGNNCSQVCANKVTNGAALLFVTFNVTEDISLNQSLQNINGWCNVNLPNDTADGNPRCYMKAKDAQGNERELDTIALSAPNTMSINIDSLAEDRAWVLTLIEESSKAKSDSIQIIKYSADTPLGSLGPLKNAPITQYSCINRMFSTDNDTGDIYYDAAFRVHFYFIQRSPPDPVPAGSSYVCHDWLNPLYGEIDDILYPRLEQVASVFNLWDSTDPRFYDINNNGNNEINDIIIQKAKNFGLTTIGASTNFFEKFPVLASTQSTQDAGSNTSTAQSMGYYMYPWIDNQTFKSYCLNSTHYNSDNALFKAMRDVIGVDMEGIYVGVKAAESVRDRSGNIVTAPADFILIRETDLKSVWFYLNNGVPTVPTDANVSSKAVFFYYPLNKQAPYIPSSTQKLYQVKGATELSAGTVNTGGSSSSGVNSNYPPHDRKIGCVPKF